MEAGGEAMREDRRALCRLAGTVFVRLRREYPGWGFGELRKHLGLPDTKLFRELAEEAGFRLAGTLSPSEENAVLRALRRGVFGGEDVACETGLPLAKVEDFLDEVGVPFGAGGWGMFPWPGKPGERAPGRPSRPEPRRVSKKGQISYRGRVYGLGSLYARSVTWVEDRGDKLVCRFSGARFPDEPTVTLYRTG